MLVLKWLCIIVVCLDVIAYAGDKFENKADIVTVIGVILGILARVYVIYGAYTCWLVK